MGYGFGVFLLALGLILAFAVQDAIEAVDLTMVGYILAGAGVLVIVLTRGADEPRPPAHSVATTTHSDGSQTVAERRTEQDPPAGLSRDAAIGRRATPLIIFSGCRVTAADPRVPG